MKSILILVSSLGEGGAERIACRLASEFADTGRYIVYLMPFSKSMHLYNVSGQVKVLQYAPFTLRQPSSPVLTCKKVAAGIYMFVALSLFRIKHRPDVSLSLLLAPNIYNIVAPCSGRRVLSERNNPLNKGRLHYILSKWAYRHGDLIVFQNETIRKLFPGCTNANSCILPNPVSVSCTAKENRIRKIVNAGKLKPQKNQVMLIHAFSIFLQSHPDYILEIYGQGPLQDKLESEIVRLGISRSVRIRPFTDDLHSEIADAEIFVLSSDYEGQPNALMEAMMMGIACISADYDGEPVIQNGKTGIVTPKGDPVALAAAMRFLSDNPEIRHSFERNAMDFMKTFSPETVIPKWEKALFL